MTDITLKELQLISDILNAEGLACKKARHREILEAVLSLPPKYRNVVYLYYYEEYTAPQISQILHKNVNTVYTLLTRSRQLLKEKLEGDEYEW